MAEDQATRHYRGQAGERYHGEKRAIPAAAVSWVAKLRAEKISPYIGAADVVFEYGVGAGWNLAQLQCKQRIGYDVSELVAPGVSALGIEFVFDPKNLSDSSMDVAICHHTLEHVLNPPEVLREIRRVIKPGGALLLFVPHEREGKYAEFNPNEPNHHLYSWNVQTLGNLVEECGFKVVEWQVGRFGYDRFASTWAVRLHAGEFGFRALRNCLQMMKPAFEVRMVAKRI